MVEQEAQPRPREALQPPDHLHQSVDEALLLLASELDLAPALRQPDLLAVGDQLQREQHGDDLEHVGGAAGRERQRRHAQQQHEQDREALAAEYLDQPTKGLVMLVLEPPLELVTDSLLGCGWLCLRARRGVGGRLWRLGHP